MPRLIEANRNMFGWHSFTLDPGSIVALDCGHTDYVQAPGRLVGVF